MGLLSAIDRLGRGGLRLAGLRGRWIEGPHGRVNVYEGAGGGTLPTLVLQHGIGAANATHFTTLALLARRHFRRIVIPELPGHGYSEPAPVMTPEHVYAGFEAALDAILDEPAVVYGNSLGGAMAMRFAQDRPERTRALVLTSPAGARLDPRDWPGFLAGFDMPDAAAAMAFFERLHHRMPLGARWVAADVARQFNRPHMRALFDSVREGMHFEPEAVAGVKAPTLLVWGRSDRIMHRDMLTWYRTHLPRHARVEEPEGIGHCPQLEHPRWTLGRILEFVREHAPR